MGSNKNKNQGTRFERSLVNRAKERGLTSKRSYASNGLSMGEVKEVDLKIDGLRISCKSHQAKHYPKYLTIPEGVDALVIKELKPGSKGKEVAIIDLELLLYFAECVKMATNLKVLKGVNDEM